MQREGITLDRTQLEQLKISPSKISATANKFHKS